MDKTKVDLLLNSDLSVKEMTKEIMYWRINDKEIPVLLALLIDHLRSENRKDK